MSSLPVSELTAHLGYWLRYVSNHVSHAFAARVAAQGITVAEWVVLRALYGKEPTQPSRLADELGMSRGAITRLADRLIGKSLLVREASPDDGRAQTLALTSKGEALVPELAAQADANDDAFFDHLTPEERRTMERLLRRTVEHHGLGAVPTD